jgi:hypothetical protein
MSCRCGELSKECYLGWSEEVENGVKKQKGNDGKGDE